MPPPNNNIYDPLWALALTKPLVLYVNYGEYENIATSISSHATDALIWTCYGSPISDGQDNPLTKADSWFSAFTCKQKVRVLILKNRSQYKEYDKPRGDKVQRREDFEKGATNNGTLLYTTKRHVIQRLGCPIIRSLDIGYVESGNDKIIFFSDFERHQPGTMLYMGIFGWDTNRDFGDSAARSIFVDDQLHKRLITAVKGGEGDWYSESNALCPPWLPIAPKQIPRAVGWALWQTVSLFILPGIFGKASNAVRRTFLGPKE